MAESERVSTETRDDDAYNAYYNASKTATELTTMISMKAPGNKKNLFIQFKREFIFLSFMTRTHKNINKDLILKVDEWTEAALNNSDKTILMLIKIFKEYTSHLVDLKVL